MAESSPRAQDRGWRRIAVVAAVISVLAVELLVATRLRSNASPTLLTSAASQTWLSLPEDALVLRMADAPVMETPFVRQPRPAGEGSGEFVAIPDRGGADNERGRIEIPFQVQHAGTYAAWIRGRWDNQCGNSVRMKMDDGNDLACEDAVYGTWHWVRAGRYTLSAGAHRAVLAGREDGIALDELLLTRSAAFIPAAQSAATAAIPDLRRTADNFDRSPGHGLDPWQAVSGQWEILFTLDPNRIADQYALSGRPSTNGAEAVAVLQTDPWRGLRLAVSYAPTEAGEAGVVLEQGGDGPIAVTFAVTGSVAQLLVATPAGVQRRDLGERVRVGQWHRVTIERWAWVLRVFVDGEPVWTSCDLPPAHGGIGLCVRTGAADFDDVAVEEIPFQADDGAACSIPWEVPTSSHWLRTGNGDGRTLVGKRGEIRTGLNRLPIHAVFVDERPGSAACGIAGPPLAEAWHDGSARLLAADAGGSVRGSSVAIAPGAGPAALRRAAVAYGLPVPDTYTEGPYHFTEPMVEDLSDYLDFTPDELRQTVDPGQADKMRREEKTFPVVGRHGDGCPWAIEAGHWVVRDGALEAVVPGKVQHWRTIHVGFEMQGRVRLAPPASAARFVFYAGLDNAVRVDLTPQGNTLLGATTNGVCLPVPADGVWHTVRVRMDGTTLAASVDDGERRTSIVTRGIGGAIQLECVAGRVQFDDLRFTVPRAAPGEFSYGFDRRETDWWREGGTWIDHGGIACALASQWTSLVAPSGRGVLWHKRSFGPNLVAAVTIEENSEWFGWRQDPTHRHHPYDNINVLLTPAPEWDAGYRLEVNGRNRTATVLYRLGTPVAEVAQDQSFPVTYVGGHQPYEPRRNLIVLARDGTRLRAFVNGVEVLHFDDPAPLAVGHVGVGGHDTRANFSRIEIREL